MAEEQMKPSVEEEPRNLVEFLQWLKANDIPQEQHKRYINRFLTFKAARNGIPIAGSFELTPFCNLDCKMCFVHLNKAQLQGSQVLTTDQWKNLMKQAVDAGMRKATLTGGECLLYPDFDELYLYLLSLGVEVSIFSNGILLNKERIEFFKKYPPIGIRVTLYGSCNEVYQNVTGFPQFDTVWHNVLLAKSEKLPISIAITPNLFMGDDGERLVEKVFSSGIVFNINSSLVAPREETGRKDCKIDAPIDTYIKMYIKRLELNKVDYTPIPISELPDTNTTGRQTFGIKCFAGKSYFYINWRGELMACPNVPMYVEQPLKSDFLSCWKSIHCAVEQMEMPMECADCAYNDFCVCPAVHLQNGSIAHCNKNWCKHIKTLVSHGIFELSHECE